jgi:hypothetical protein
MPSRDQVLQALSKIESLKDAVEDVAVDGLITVTLRAKDEPGVREDLGKVVRAALENEKV